MGKITVVPIGRVISSQTDSREDYWGPIVSTIELDRSQFQTEALVGLDEFSHIEVLFHLSQVPEQRVEMATRHPRNNPAWPKVGILAQRAKMRPNRIGATICELLKIDGLKLTVRGLDAFNATPVLDIKPVFAEFIPDKNLVRQPQWSHEMMAHYFSSEQEKSSGS